MQAVNKNPTVREIRTFGFVMLAGFAFVGAVLWHLGRITETGWGYSSTGPHNVAVALWCMGGGFAMICSASRTMGKILYVIWMTGSMYLGMVMSTVLLSVLFFVLLPVFSLIRLSDPLRQKMKASGTYWENHKPHEATIERTRRPF